MQSGIMPIHKVGEVAEQTFSITPACQGNVEPEIPRKPQVAETLVLEMNTYTDLCLRLIQSWQNI